jgi:tRNA nucleotidyltransferase/poly(A) polymerase
MLSISTPRVFRLAGPREIDFADLAGSAIEEDLARRDFTVNAIAVEIPGAIWVDPFGGIADLRARRLRIVRPKNLRDDPARVLRAARFMATHELDPDLATSRACRGTAGELAGVAPERLRIELTKLLEAPRVVAALTWAARVNALAPALGVSAAAARRLRRKLPLLDQAAIRRLDPAARRRIRLALVAAGLGLSPSESSRWLRSRRFSRQESGETALLLDLAHRAGRANSDRRRWEWVRDAAGNAEDALRLFALRAPGRHGQARALESRVKRARSGPPVRGSDLLKWLEIEPGPRVGALLRELELESLRGAIRTRREARAWLTDRIRGG